MHFYGLFEFAVVFISTKRNGVVVSACSDDDDGDNHDNNKLCKV